MYTLKLCIGMFLSICGQVREFDFPSREDCERERSAQVVHVGDGYAICSPKGSELKREK